MKLYCDEVGMASIFGPACVVCVAFDNNEQKIEGVKDSKKLSKKKREQLFDDILNECEYSIKYPSVEYIKEHNVYWAKLYAMRDAVIDLSEKLGLSNTKVIVDGNAEIPGIEFDQEAVVKADDKFWQVGVASIIAKVCRDRLIADYGKEERYSHYDLKNNAGYYSPNHRDGITLHGITDLHRKKFLYTKYCLWRHKKYLHLLENGTIKNYDHFLLWSKQVYQNSSEFKIWKKGGYLD